MNAVLDFLVKGGVTMIPLFLCSLIGLAIIIEKIIALRRKVVLIPEVIAVIDNISSPEDIALVLAVCKKHNGPLPNIVRTALNNKELPSEELKELILDNGRQEIRHLERGLVGLETIAAISPLLGLLGTVIGILKVFNVISKMGVGQATALSGGISEALISTIVGLVIGIPAVVAYNYFSRRAENFILDIEKYTSAVLLKLRSFKGQGSELSEAFETS